MLVVSGEITVDPEHHDELLALADAVVPPSVDEPGCSVYEFWLHRSTPGVVHVFEVWADADALVAHTESDHYRTFARGLRGLGGLRVEIERYPVADT